ncbi:hypothetical protein Sjap_020324 [Stephania japonica]|uniref:Uncharacterized protein n=1 Tax=Stephania japonica TaxID=461633 RepID=A0AAP0F363_9MAGN
MEFQKINSLLEHCSNNNSAEIMNMAEPFKDGENGSSCVSLNHLGNGVVFRDGVFKLLLKLHDCIFHGIKMCFIFEVETLMHQLMQSSLD